MLLTNFRFVKNCNTRRHRQGVCWGGECRWCPRRGPVGPPSQEIGWEGTQKPGFLKKPGFSVPQCAGSHHCREDILGVGFGVEIVAFIDLSDLADFVYDVGDALGFLAFYNVVSFGDGTIHIC
jgi:hypothetical protein